MKNWRKVAALVLALALVVSMAACGGDSGSSTPAPESKPASEPASTPESTPESKPASEPADDASEPADEPATDEMSTPRNETVYLGGMQYGKPVNNNPMSSNANYMVIAQGGCPRISTWETLYAFNMVDGKAYPLLADGDWTWNADNTVMTIKLKEAAHWSDGTPFTAKDVETTWAFHFKYQTSSGIDLETYVESVKAIDDHTVEITGKPVNGAVNMLKLQTVACNYYIMQAAYLEKVEAEKSAEFSGDDLANEMRNAEFFDAPVTGPYLPALYDSEQKCVWERDDNYWGQDASMWGKLPVPKYLVHNIYSGNDATATAFMNEEIDMNQQFMANVQTTWEDQDLPVTTFYDEPPYHIAVSIPTAWYNTTKEGLDQAAVRKAIAMAADYDQINASAMTKQSPTFTEVPRSLFNPTEGEQSLIADPEALKPLQFTGKDIEGAKKLLDEANIVDTDGDGIREYPAGNNLSFKAECPKGWTDWNSSLEIVAAAGKEIGISIETYFPEAAVWTDDMQTGNYEIAMNTVAGADISSPWLRAYQTMYGFGGSFPERVTFSYSRWYNERADELLSLIPAEADENKVKEYYQELNELYLTEVPSFGLMYRPAMFHIAYEGVWTGWPTEGDDTPPMCGIYGYGIKMLYEIELVEG